MSSNLTITKDAPDYNDYALPPNLEERRRDEVLTQIRLGGNKLPLDLSGAVITADMELTMEGASTVTFSFADDDRKILKSKYLTDGTRIAIPRSDQTGKWDRFALVKISKQGDLLNLTFEEENIWILRKYSAPLKVSRDTMTRAQFAYYLCREPKPRIPFFSPELLDVQPVGISKRTTTRTNNTNDTLDIDGRPYGFTGDSIKVKGVAADNEQKSNIAQVLTVGVKMKVPKSLLTALVMVVVQESEGRNLPGGDRDSRGLFQQRLSSGYVGIRTLNVEKQTREFLLGIKEADESTSAIAIYKRHPDYNLAELITRVQNPQVGFDSQYTKEVKTRESDARETVYAFLGADARGYRGDTDRIDRRKYATYEFMRGDPEDPRKRENSWDCMGRLAEEVNWVRFCYRGTVYFMSQEELYGRKHVARFNEFSPGVVDLDFDYDAGKKVAEISLTALASRWFAPPGSTVVVYDTGPANGRWLIKSFNRSLFAPVGTFTLVKPEPKLPEPAPEQKSQDFNLDTGLNVTSEGAQRVADIAIAQVNRTSQYTYAQERPYPPTLNQSRVRTDCSGFAILTYKDAGLPDPNGTGFNGSGSTVTLQTKGRLVENPQAGDLAFYGSRTAGGNAGHVAVCISATEAVGFGSQGGPRRHAIRYRSDFIGVRRYVD